MTDLIRMNVDQMRQVAIKNNELREQQEKNYQAKVEQMSKHNVGGLYDIERSRNQISLKNKKFILIQIK